jgi:hypothetical protein
MASPSRHGHVTTCPYRSAKTGSKIRSIGIVAARAHRSALGLGVGCPLPDLGLRDLRRHIGPTRADRARTAKKKIPAPKLKMELLACIGAHTP